jgi:hypothetical protein
VTEFGDHEDGSQLTFSGGRFSAAVAGLPVLIHISNFGQNTPSKQSFSSSITTSAQSPARPLETPKLN